MCKCNNPKKEKGKKKKEKKYTMDGRALPSILPPDWLPSTIMDTYVGSRPPLDESRHRKHSAVQPELSLC
jgi:hypothetical protein